LHRLAGFAILHALRFEPGHFAVPHHKRYRARNALLIDGALDLSGNSLKPFRREANGYGRGGRKPLGGSFGGRILGERGRKADAKQTKNGRGESCSGEKPELDRV
jgi:hypothetical protein